MSEEIFTIEVLRTIAPARKVSPVTPDDNNDLTDGVCDALYVKTAGNLHFVASDGGSDTWPVTAGQIVPVRVIRVLVNSTTATVAALY